MTRASLISLVGLAALISCSKSEITLPPKSNNPNLEGTTYVEGTIMKSMEGIYQLTDGDNGLGTEFVCKVSRFRVSFFSKLDGIFIILKYGLNPVDSSLQFSGFWRYSENPTQGNIQFSVSSADGAKNLFKGVVSNLKLKGVFGDDIPSRAITLEFERPFTPYAMSHEFMVFAHHGVQTTSNPPFAENSLNGVLNDEDYGVNGLEFDVRMTKDHVPICIHDSGINTRLTQKGPLSGNWDQYGFPFLSDYIRLIDGQKVPSVEQVLKKFIDSTTLKYMWMDIKGNPDIFKYLEPIVRNAYAEAAKQNREVIIFAGMPSDEVIQEFKNQPTYATLPTLCEETIDKAIENKSSFFGPRFSQGLILDQVEKAHNNGIKVISWTLNDKNLIINYVKNGKFDGFISDYPAYVVYHYYTNF